jgi:hypothetical protein
MKVGRLPLRAKNDPRETAGRSAGATRFNLLESNLPDFEKT